MLNKKTTDNENELFVVVDENDNIIDYRRREECHSDKSLIHRSTGIVIFNNKGKILVQKRSQTKDLYPGYFTISCAGHVKKDEEYEDAAKREMFEEIGIKVPLKFINKKLLKLPLETEFDTLFTAVYDGQFKTSKDEVESVEFVDPESIKDLQDKLTPYAILSFKRLGIL